MPDWSFIDQRNQLDELHGDLKDKKSEGLERSDPKYKKLISGDFNIFKRARLFLLGRNEGGKVAKRIKDKILPFLPKQNLIRLGSKLITTILGGNKMSDSTPKKPTKSKTIIINVIIGLASLGVLVGILPVDPETLNPDAAWVGVVYSIVNVILRAITGKPISFNEGK